MPGIVDVHHHIMLPEFLAIQEARIRRTGYWGEKLTQWTPQWSIEEMDKNGAAVSILSISAPGSWTGKIDESRKLARTLNDYKAQIVRDHPGRFGFFATIPLPDVEGSLAEIVYACDVLKADGICLLTNYDSKYPGDPAFAPVYDELNRRKAIVYSHPAAVDCCVNMVPGVPMAILEFMFDNTRAIVSLLQNGTFARCPDIKFIFSHCGGALSGVAGRVNGWSRAFADKAPGGALAALKKLAFDTASMNNPATFAAMFQLAGPKNIMFGSDFPWGTIAASKDPLRALGLSAEDLHNIEEGNARRMFARLKPDGGQA
ncbi:MAG TPA: amidohydrolase family protein [Stellaceae bacterium]|nr:amidohydrolase family protein [Stellaceae bacterium]